MYTLHHASPAGNAQPRGVFTRTEGISRFPRGLTRRKFPMSLAHRIPRRLAVGTAPAAAPGTPLDRGTTPGRREATMTPTRLFVYGSLRRNATGAHHPLLGAARLLGAATVEGALYRVAWYPGLVLEAGGGEVRGELYELPSAGAGAMLAALDDYEGAGFGRRHTQARLDATGESLDTWMYAYLGDTPTLERIPSGDYGVPEHRSRP